MVLSVFKANTCSTSESNPRAEIENSNVQENGPGLISFFCIISCLKKKKKSLTFQCVYFYILLKCIQFHHSFQFKTKDDNFKNEQDECVEIKLYYHSSINKESGVRHGTFFFHFILYSRGGGGGLGPALFLFYLFIYINATVLLF
jgi:hypothetical protein